MKAMASAGFRFKTFKKSTKNTLLLFFILAQTAVFAQISGTVIDAVSNLPVEKVAVSAIKSGEVALTDAEGRFVLRATVPDSLQFSHPGYYLYTKWVTESFVQISLFENPIELEEVVISAFEANRNSLTIAAPVTNVALFKGGMIDVNPESLIEINTQPGVQFEQRSNSSYRINIRGSSLRSPFDVRNVKVYWNGIPYTEAGGSTSFNLLDPSFFGNMEIIRGPSSSLYGAGNGGVILIDSKKEKGKFVEYGFTAGSFGFQKHNFAAGLPAGSGSHTIHFSNVKVDGYRNHSEMDRSTFEYNGLFSINSDQSIEANILYTDLFYEIPGGLNATQYNADPQQARPGNPFAMGSEESNASAKVKNLLMGLNYENELSSNLTLKNSFYSVVQDFESPFIFDYKREAQQGIGTRNTLQYQHDMGLAKLKHTLGVEFQYSFTSARNYGNVAGVSDTLNFDDQIRNRQSVLFLQSEFQREKLHLTAGLSVNHLKYDIYRLWDAELDSTYQFVRNFDPVITPRISALYNFGNISVFGVAGYGFSPPTLDEVRTNEGSLNSDINAEKGVNYEIGSKAEILSDLNVEFSAFYYQLKNTIVDYTSPRGTDLFRNSGSTNQKGVEVSARYDLPNRKEFRLENSVYLSYTYHDFKFREYIINANDYSGNYLPGIAPHTVSMTWNTTDKSGLYFSAFYLYKDAIPLNNVNDVEANNFHLLNLKMGYKKDVRMRYHEGANNLVKTSDQLNVYVGINNTLDKKYSLGNDVNAFGGRYYQPAASRNFVVGVSYKLGY